MQRERTFFSLLIAVGIAAAIFAGRALLLPVLSSGDTLPPSFWVDKVNAPARFDMVLLGDSRAYRDLAPEVFEEMLPDFSVLNFGFSSGGLNPTIMAAAAAKLRPDSLQPMLVLAISPHSLSDIANENEHYNEIFQQGQRLDYLLEPVAANPLPEPVSLNDLRDRYKQTAPTSYYHQEARRNGWVASNKTPPEIEVGVATYEDLFREPTRCVTRANVQSLATAVEDAVAEGLCVYAFRTPTSPQVIAIEDRASGYADYPVADIIAAAGAIWLDVDLTAYPTYDGSHMTETAARRFSADIAEAILARPCPQNTPEPG